MVAANIANMKPGNNQHAQNCATSQEKAAELLNTSRRSVQHATKVKGSGVPELSEKVMAGEVAVSTASDITELPLLVFSAVEQPPH